ncbi:MAG TPA: amidohydrolase family protein [Bryobacteraceae bacterium]|nr:amidohydrolase family protein [Bryobacteraceae bacterium]
MIARRKFIRGAVATIAALPAKAQEIPNSVGTNHPKLKAPAHACDCHMHIYDPDRFPLTPNPKAAPTRAAVPQYRMLQTRIGTTRVVIVTPRNYGINNNATLDAISQLGDARGVAVLHPTVTDAELKKLNDGGIRGIRFSLGDPKTAAVTPDMVEPLAKRVAPLGWHIQFYIGGEQIVELADVLRRLPTQIVFDHLGGPPLPAGITHPSHAIVRGLLDQRRAWVKLSGAYINSKIGPPSYPEAATVARDFVKAAPERLVWGSDWPHPGLPDDHKPDDALLFDLLSVWAPDEATRNRILVRNPETLYGFAKSV